MTINYLPIVENQIRAGDVVVFYGGGFISRLIRLCAEGPSHVGVIRQPATEGRPPRLIESTRQDGRNGVQTNPLPKTLATYPPNSSAAVLFLRDEVRALIDWQKFYAFCGQAEDTVRYDTEGLFEFFLREVPILGVRVAQEEHKNKMVCSAFTTALFEACGVFRGMNWSKMRPQDLVEAGIYSHYLPLLGKPKLTRFNTL
jgi:hypothetical protein